VDGLGQPRSRRASSQRSDFARATAETWESSRCFGVQVYANEPMIVLSLSQIFRELRRD
jgi:hypothetical protein